MLVAAFTWGDLWRLALAVFLFAVGLSFATCSYGWPEPSRGFPRSFVEREIPFSR